MQLTLVMVLKMRLNEIFHIEYGKFKIPINELNVGHTPLISSGSINNGVVGFFNLPYLYSNVISVARTGSVGETFFHKYKCVINSDCMVLTPKNELTENEMYWYTLNIAKYKKCFSYGRKVTPERLGVIEINSKIPNWVHKINIEELDLSKRLNKSKQIPVHEKKWKPFRYDEIFIIENGYYNKKPPKSEDGDICFIGASEYNNGITSYHSLIDIEIYHKDGSEHQDNIENKIYNPNCITVANNGNSVASAFYQERKFTCTHDINVLRLKNNQLNKYIALFLCALIKKEKYRWSYGRKWRPTRMPESIIKLPVNEKENPDWKFMENYIKSLPYSSNL